MPFWTGVNSSAQDPKRESRFKVSIASLNNDGIVWYAKSFSKPTATIKTAAHRYLNHTFYYPGSLEWNEVTLEMIDPTDPVDMAGSLAQLVEALGYQIPTGGSSLANISKRKGVETLGAISISHIDDEGEETETWKLEQAFVTKVEWGSMKYESDNLNTLKVSFRYDWATCEIIAAKSHTIASISPVLDSTTKSFFSSSAS